MTFAEIKSDVRRKVNEADATFYTDTDIEDAIHEAMDEISDATEYYERQATIQLTSGRTYYDLSLILPDTFLSPRRCQNTTTHKWLDPTDPREMDFHTYVQWELTSGSADRYLMRGNWWFGVWPKPSGDNVKVRFIYTAIAPHLSRSTDEPEFAREYHPGIVDLAVSDLLAQARMTKLALKSWASGQTYVQGLADSVEGRQSLDKRSVL